MSVEFDRVVVLGAGTMGAGIAQVCAAAGSRVMLKDMKDAFLAKALASITAFLQKGVEKGKTTQQELEQTLGRIATSADPQRGFADAQLVIEAVPEELDLKRGLFSQAAELCGADTVLATNTSSLSLAAIFAGIPAPQRCIGTHFFNPPPLMPLLELVRTERTSEATIARVQRYAAQLGKEPILVKDSPGFASSRLGVALGLEAIRMVEAGVASADDIDKAMTLGYRHPMGPLRLTDLVGLDVRMAIADYLRAELDSPVFEVPALMRRMVEDGRLGKKSGRGFYVWE
jgi:3-hydroxybutyryl-CoA dehydrogenase